MPRVFISHATADRDVVTRDVIDLLRDHKVDVWFAEDDIAAARQWERSIFEGLKTCDWFLIALTPRAVKSEWVRDEVHWALEERAGRIVPVLLEECDQRDIHIRLPRIQYVDFRNVDDDARTRLLACWGIEYRPSSRFELSCRRLLDRYSIGERLSSRDCLEEYLAEDLTLNRPVLLKCDRYHENTDPSRLTPIAVEAYATAVLVHPAIPRVFDLGHDAELGAFSILEHIPGESLRSRLEEKGPLPADQAPDLIKPVCEAVHFANERGVIHRNIKPGSVIVGENQQVYLTNFIAAQFDDRPGELVGTPAYIAPEQCQQGSVDRRADVWGLGVLLYELLTGTMPFRREGAVESFKAILHDSPTRPRALNGAIPSPLEEICLRCLEKDPAKRYETALELAAALDEWRRPKRWVWPWK